jgi:hypothetical protein
MSVTCGGGDTGRALVPGSLRGYRTWRVLSRRAALPEGALPLGSVTRPVVWPPTLEAQCTPPDFEQNSGVASTAVAGSHRSPARRCDCGIYAWYDPRDTAMLPARVFGAVEATGLVLMGDRGFRAERARIRAVVTRNRRLAAACEAAGIRVYRRRGALLRDFPADDVAGLLSASSKPESRADAGSGQALDRFDAIVCAAVWGRAALLVLAAVSLPPGALLAGAILTEAGLFALVASRTHA